MDTFLQTAFQSLADPWCFPFSCSSLSALVQKMVVKCLHLDLTFCITQDIFACLPDLRTFYRKHGNKHQDLHLGVDSGPPKAHTQPYLQESSFTTNTKVTQICALLLPCASQSVPLSLSKGRWQGYLSTLNCLHPAPNTAGNVVLGVTGGALISLLPHCCHKQRMGELQRDWVSGNPAATP